MIEIVNIKVTTTRKNERWYRVDRKTKWGNPHVIGNCKCGVRHSRAQAIAAYKRDLQAGKLAVRADDIASEIGDAEALGCWCAPQRCHAEVIKNVIMYSRTKKVEVK